ncbi:hypothetical protein Tco_0101243 [Tanacetum coccineum]
MEKTQFKPKELLPYGMLLTRLFKHVVSVSPEQDFDHFLSHDRAMHPLAPHYERKTQADRGKKIPCESNASSSSTTLNHPSSSLPLDHMVDENDDESFHSNSSSPYPLVPPPTHAQVGCHASFCHCCRYTTNHFHSLRNEINFIQFLVTRIIPQSQVHHHNESPSSSLLGIKELLQDNAAEGLNTASCNS